MPAIETLTRAEKLRMLETLWDDLTHDSATMSSPAWHGDALKSAERAHASGQADFIDWETAKQRLRDGKA